MSEPSTSAPIELQNVRFSIGQATLLDGIDLRVRRGERVAIIGPSGAGKTTLLNLLSAAFIPSSGHCMLLGLDSANLHRGDLAKLRKSIGVVHQANGIVDNLRVVHNVLMGRLPYWSRLRALWSLIRPQERELAEQALQQVELADRLWDYPTELSMGEQQRVTIARLLVQRPTIIIADEPSSALDIRLGKDVMRLLNKVSREQNAALVVSLHSLDLLAGNFDRVVALKNGRIEWEGPPDSLRQSTLKQVYATQYQSLELRDE